MKTTITRWAAAAAITLLAACGTGDTADVAGGGGGGGGTDSQSHWLTVCAEDTDCGDGFECLCGVCSVVCDDGDPCETDPDSACVPSASPVLEALCGGIDLPSGLCLPECGTDDDCADGQLCSDGSCVPFTCPDVEEPECPGRYDRAEAIIGDDGCETWECLTECPPLPSIECGPGEELEETVVDGCTLVECVTICPAIDMPECPPGEVAVGGVDEDGCETWTCEPACADPGDPPLCERGTTATLVPGDDGCDTWACLADCEELGDPPTCEEDYEAAIVTDDIGCEAWECRYLCEDPDIPLPCEDGSDPELTFDEFGCEFYVCPPPGDTSWAQTCGPAADCGPGFACVCGMCTPMECEVDAACGPDETGLCAHNGGHPGVDMACGEIDAVVNVCALTCDADADCNDGMTCVDALCVPTERLVFECDTFTCDPDTEHCQESLPGVPGPAWYECGDIPEACLGMPRGERCECLIAESEFGAAMDCREDVFGFLRTMVAFP